MRIYLGSQDGGIVHYWAGKYPNLVGQCFSPPQFNPRAWMPYFLDNGAYKYYANHQKFDEGAFFSHLEKVKFGIKIPEFVVIPDAIGNHDRTLEMWDYFYPKAIAMKPALKYAFVTQDGCEVENIPEEADFIFIGGTDSFKKLRLKNFADTFSDRVHVGRVNNLDFVFRCHDLGIASIDGTGWFRSNHGKPTYMQLEQYFEYCQGRGNLPFLVLLINSRSRTLNPEPIYQKTVEKHGLDRKRQTLKRSRCLGIREIRRMARIPRDERTKGLYWN